MAGYDVTPPFTSPSEKVGSPPDVVCCWPCRESLLRGMKTSSGGQV
jgi:hypothetical protein